MTGEDAAPTGERAISTVLDAVLFLLLVSAAVGVLYGMPDPVDESRPDPDVAAEGATTLSTSLQTIEYTPATLEGTDQAATRADRGSIAELLAETTVANAAVGDRNVTVAPNHQAAVRAATRHALYGFPDDVEVQVRTRWRPFPGSGLQGGFTVGPSPPSDADVHAATVAVPVDTAVSSGGAEADWRSPAAASPADDPADEHDSLRPGRSTSLTAVAERHGCSGLAHVLASRVVGTAFPPERTELSTRVPGPQRRQLEAQYETAAIGIGVAPEAISDVQSIRRRNEFLAAELADRFEATCRGYDSPTEAAERAKPGTVVVSIRTWSP